MKYTFTLSEEGQPREKTVLESRAGESDRHIALKILAFLLFREEAAPLPLRIEPHVGQRHRPDLVVTEPETDRVLLWIDCGAIETKRLGRIAAANPRTQIVVVKPTEGEARLYARAARRFLSDDPERLASIRFLGFEEGFLPGFLTNLRGVNYLSLCRREEGATFTLNATTYLTRVRLFTAASLPDDKDGSDAPEHG